MRFTALAPRRLHIGPASSLLLALLIAAAIGQDVRADSDESVTSGSAASAEKPVVVDFSKPMGPSDPFNRGTPQGSLSGRLSHAEQGFFNGIYCLGLTLS